MCEIDPKWLVEMAPRFFRAADPHKLSRRKRHERIEPLYDRFAEPNEWRLRRVMKKKDMKKKGCRKRSWRLTVSVVAHVAALNAPVCFPLLHCPIPFLAVNGAAKLRATRAFQRQHRAVSGTPGPPAVVGGGSDAGRASAETCMAASLLLCMCS